jgi:predicted CoA-substrate-specific enzyme activase
LDIGSTTAKAVVLDENDRIIHSSYRRHFADIRASAGDIMCEIRERCSDSMMTLVMAGSGALALAEGMHVPFAQELVACRASVERYLARVDVSIELGGEDAKLTFFDDGGIDQRMNETCAGGTGAFLDQMAALLGTDAAGLNELAKGCRAIYPIASRCGVFAKTDVQPLLNDGASRSDIAASIFQAIVNQTISGLACGRKISGNVAFLGGPLYFLSELRARFAETLGLSDEQCVFPENPHLFVAIGAAILGKRSGAVDMARLYDKAALFLKNDGGRLVNVLPALFIGKEARDSFEKRHSASRAARGELAGYSGDAFLGVDVGSTTTKVVLIGRDGELLFSRYRPTGGGEPIQTVRELLLDLYREMPPGVTIKRSGVTGYGEKLVKSAFGMDVGEVETVAHAMAADFVIPGAEFVIDIGGQDMKCLGIKDGVIRRVFLNEACSSGCGSFIQTFAESLEMTVDDFAEAAMESMMPVDLGSRCTVFMNSRVRQAQKEGASVSDISAGLVYSVVRNALYKVLKIRSADELGERIVVQGGAFKNDAILRAFELISGREVVRPEISELMGAFGVALAARDTDSNAPGAMLGAREVAGLRTETGTSRCGGCGNRCILTKTRFDDGRAYVSGNRCERGADGAARREASSPPNMFKRKYERLFNFYKPMPDGTAPRGAMGIPRVLNMYENYPFWFTLFTDLGFRVELSGERPDPSLGFDTIPSQTVCYPAKIVHRHLLDLISRGVRRIFYPIVLRESREFPDAHQDFNCPIVTGYPDAVFLNIDELREPGVDFMCPAIPLELSGGQGGMLKALLGGLERYGVAKRELRRALRLAAEAQRSYKSDVRRYGDEVVEYLKSSGGVGIVLAGHPYHLDPEVHHGIPELICGYGVAVLTEDSICHRANEAGGVGPLYVVDQWTYHSRLYRAASAVAGHPDLANVQMVQLNSFGCGLDAISADQAAAILERGGKLHTLIKVDEGKNNGAVNIRIRSLLSSVRMKSRAGGASAARLPSKADRAGGAPRDAARTILCPPLSVHHFQFLEAAMRSDGRDFRLLPEGGRESVELGLKYVNNDACYPAMVVVGQFLKALMSGEHDPDTTDCLYAQTGGACRASNYVPLLRGALDAAGFARVRILAANAQANSGAERFTAPARVVWRSVLGLLYGDVLMRVLHRTRPYELRNGDADAMYDSWVSRCKKNVVRGSWRAFKQDVTELIRDFGDIPADPTPRPRVGIVGEILVKYHANANEHLVEVIEREGGEAVVPDLTSFILYCLFDPVYSHKKLSGPLLPRIVGEVGIRVLEHLRAAISAALAGTRFGRIHDIRDMAESVCRLVSPANQAGEGWLLASEMMRLIEDGVKNVICVQPFACLPNHVTGKGVMKELRRLYRGANILALDYDSSVSNVNQLNRIKLLMASADV